MIALLQLLSAAAAILLLAPVVILFTEVLLAVTSRPAAAPRAGKRPSIAVLMPAHDEASLIANTVQTVRAELRESDRLLVVADNCSDDTASIAAHHGAEVIERADLARRGKGYAIDFGIRHLAARPPDVVLIVDADCRIDAASIDLLAQTCADSGRPVQALYLMQTPARSGVMTRIAAFAGVVKNLVRATGMHCLGLPCQLMGTGMAFPWRCIRNVDLATGDIVEDVRLGIALVRASMPPLFCPEARVTSFFPTSNEGFRSQRTRWEHGHLQIALRAPFLLLEAIAARNVALLGLALDLCVPPLALLVLLVATLWTLSAALYVVTRSALPLGITTVSVLLLALAVLLAWVRYGRQIVSLGELALAVVYAAWKIPLYARFLLARQLQWVRSKRD